MKSFMKRIVSVITIGAVSAALLAGCGNTTASGSTTTTGDVAVTMDQGSVSMGEARLYAYVMKSQYEAYYGSSIWDMEFEEGKTFGESMKDVITEQLVQMVILSSMADDYGVSLTDEDTESVDEYVENFKTNVGEDVMEEEGITDDDVRSVVEKSTLAGYVYEAMYEAEEVELSDEEKEEATCIKVEHILISTTDTTTTDDDGNTVDMTDEEQEAYLAQQKATAEEVLEKAKNGEDFEELADEYSSENAGLEFSFDKNGYDPVNMSYMVEEFYTASWELGEGEISDIVESQYGYHIIKCISLNDEEATEAAISNLEDDKKTASLDDRLNQIMEETTYTESEAWQAYSLSSASEDETADETATTDETATETASTDETESVTETETAAESETE